MNTVRSALVLLLCGALVLPVAGLAATPAAPEADYALTFVRTVGSSAGHVLALPDAVAFSEGDSLRLYDPTGSNLLGSLPLRCGIAGLGLVGNNVIASICDGVAVIDVTDRTDPWLVREFALNHDICLLYDGESGITGVAARGDYAYVGLRTSVCVVNWKTGETLYDVGEWATRLQVYQDHLFTLEEYSTYDEPVVVLDGLPAATWEDEVVIQYYANDFAVAADKVFSTAYGSSFEGLCVAAWDPDPILSGARIDCLYTDDTGANKVAASADSVRGDNVFTVRSGRLRWVKSAGEADLVEVASAPYTADVYDLGTGGSQYVYAAGSDGLSIFRFEHLQTSLPPSATPPQAPPPDPAPDLSQRLYLPLVVQVGTPMPNCSPAYPTVCISPPPPDLDCADIPHSNFTVLPPDPHNFDTDGDGLGCETS